MVLIANVTSGDPILPAWGNAVRDATVQVTTSGARPSSPAEGMTIYETDTEELLVYTGAQWRRPWAMPWGSVGSALAVAAQNTISAEVDLTSLAVAWTVVGNRRYRAEWHVPILKSAVAGVVTVKLTTAANVQLASTFRTEVASVSDVLSGFAIITGLVAGATTLKMRGLNGAGTFNVDVAATQPAYFAIHDIGPNGVPA